MNPRALLWIACGILAGTLTVFAWRELGGEGAPITSPESDRPVDWAPSLDEANERARASGRPLFLHFTGEG